jgi:hypothetical protein
MDYNSSYIKFQFGIVSSRLAYTFSMFFFYLYFVVNLSNELNCHWHFAYQIKNVKQYKWNKLTYNEIYKKLFFENKKLITTKLLCPQKII